MDITDPKYVGPGIWYIIHKRAFHSRTAKEEREYIQLVKKIINEFPCNECKQHALDYWDQHPIEEYIGVMLEWKGEELRLGIFLWGFIFHNNVNKRLGKRTLTLTEALQLYESACNQVCS